MTKLRFCSLSLCLLFVALSAIAQIQNGQITGDITDPSGNLAVLDLRQRTKRKKEDVQRK